MQAERRSLVGPSSWVARGGDTGLTGHPPFWVVRSCLQGCAVSPCEDFMIHDASCEFRPLPVLDGGTRRSREKVAPMNAAVAHAANACEEAGHFLLDRALQKYMLSVPATSPGNFGITLTFQTNPAFRAC